MSTPTIYPRQQFDALLAAKKGAADPWDLEITDPNKGIIFKTAGGRRARVTLVETDNGQLTTEITEL